MGEEVVSRGQGVLLFCLASTLMVIIKEKEKGKVIGYRLFLFCGHKI